MIIIRVLLVVAFATAGFLGGRAVPRSEISGSEATRMAAREGASEGGNMSTSAGSMPVHRRGAAEGSAGLQSKAASDRPSLDEQGPIVLGKEFFPEWVKLVEADSKAAHALHRAVLVELEARRRNAEDIRECFGDDAVGEIDLRFAVPVVSSSDHVEIGTADFVEVANGMPVSVSTTQCLEAALDGSRVLESSEVPTPSVSYDGRIEYIARFVF